MFTVLVILLSIMWLPAAIGVLLAETFALRSWLFHAANGVVRCTPVLPPLPNRERATRNNADATRL